MSAVEGAKEEDGEDMTQIIEVSCATFQDVLEWSHKHVLKCMRKHKLTKR